MNRRGFLRLAGSLGAAVVVDGCSRGGSDTVIPYVAPAGSDVRPGVTVQYATVCRECPAGCGLLARVRDGRVYQVEGNPSHPVNRGGICLRGQSALQGLYHPDRIRQPLRRDGRGRLRPVSWNEAEGELADALSQAYGRPAAWIGGVETGALDRLIGDWLTAMLPGHTRLTFEPFAYESLRAAFARVRGAPMVPRYRIADARMLLGFGADFLETWVSNVEYARAFAEWRASRVTARQGGRYLHIGPHLSLTGANADEWLVIRPGTQALVARALGTLIARRSVDVGALAMAAGVPLETLQRIGRQAAESRPALAIPLGTAEDGPDAVAAQEAILRLNEVTGGLDLVEPAPHALSTASTHAETLDLIGRMRQGEIGLLLVHQANPAYSLPPAAGFAEAAAKVPTIISFSSYPDETASLATMVLPDHTPLESWGDYSPWPGITGLMQPVVGPVFATRATGDLLLQTARAAGRSLGTAGFAEYVRHRYAADDASWQSLLQTGGIFAPAAAAGAPPGGSAGPAAAVQAPAGPGVRPMGGAGSPTPVEPAEGGFLLHVYPSLHFFDGRVANRPWAQEVPDPLAKAVWGSWTEIHPDAAARMGVVDGDVLQLETSGGRLQVPVLVTNRVHPGVVALQLGQGHSAYGRYASGTGVNALRLLPGTVDPRSGGLVRSGITVRVTRLPVKHAPVVLQTGGRPRVNDLARSLSLAQLAQAPAETPVPLPRRRHTRESLYLNPLKGAHHWGMVIDLDRCVGCNACAAACYAENNVPVVGRGQCARGREMSWLRIENYGGCDGRRGRGAGTVALDLCFFPMLCQHCQNAPCEYVCPVNATMHNAEGINQQVYNRCVGTRYCSNNCPYKVRRFNWFSFDLPGPLDQQLNPDVTRRRKGVMEKCSFCIQRIRGHQIQAKAEGRPLRDGEVQTACQRACPTGAITFGDFLSPGSGVRRLAGQARGYGALAHLNTYPNIVYLARVRAT